MGNITTDFITATKKIHADVRAILTALHVIGNDVKAIHEQHGSQNDEPKATEKHNGISALGSAKKYANTYEAKQYALDEKRLGLEQDAFKVGKYTLVVVAIYTGLTGYQACQSKRAADAATIAANAADQSTETTRNDQRAWVGVSKWEMVPSGPIQAGVQYAIREIIVNVGRTPAFRVDYRFAVETMTDNKPPTLQYFQRNKTQGMSAFMLPNQIIRVEDVNIPAFSETQVKQLMAGEGHLYLFARFTYQDIFGKLRTTTACVVYTPAVGDFASCGGECGAYNSAD